MPCEDDVVEFGSAANGKSAVNGRYALGRGEGKVFGGNDGPP